MSAHTWIRAATLEDTQFLPDIERSSGEAFRAVPDLAWIADDAVMSAEQHAPLIEAGGVWVAVKEARIVGFIAVETLPEAMHIWQMAVERGEQGHGLGRALLNTVIETACSRRTPAVTLTTFRDVVWNAPFYAQSGFRVLEDEALCERLRGILANEIAHGLPAERRCAMRLEL
ncbi:GNAT family N-acetyltransferase [Vitreimonas flagellata]|uniref:GNAT family N-acetyltransferase n=1 Tax=Vitreimonas flagellata TaxID=2560861 RepID=UPI0010755D58|nr:GNAT family N-acetyltransferase [Vitreimonas flagellata]